MANPAVAKTNPQATTPGSTAAESNDPFAGVTIGAQNPSATPTQQAPAATKSPATESISSWAAGLTTTGRAAALELFGAERTTALDPAKRATIALDRLARNLDRLGYERPDSLYEIETIDGKQQFPALRMPLQLSYIRELAESCGLDSRSFTNGAKISNNFDGERTDKGYAKIVDSARQTDLIALIDKVNRKLESNSPPLLATTPIAVGEVASLIGALVDSDDPDAAAHRDVFIANQDFKEQYETGRGELMINPELYEALLDYAEKKGLGQEFRDLEFGLSNRGNGFTTLTSTATCIEFFRALHERAAEG